ncbi:PQQ-dependent sugar dehydrogenase [Caulobacter segnis]
MAPRPPNPGQAAGRPVESRPPNAPEQTPAFAGQTRAPGLSSHTAGRYQVLASGLEHPWALAFLPSGEILVTERAGRLPGCSARTASCRPPSPACPPCSPRAKAASWALAIGPNYAKNGLVYWTFSEADGGVNGTSAARQAGAGPQSPGWRTSRSSGARPKMDSALHFGGRLVFAPDGKLFITTGERSILEGRVQAQKLDATLGEVIRINADGSIPQDNPFVNTPGAKPEIWSLGHRNLQAAALDPSGELWTVEHGARGGDELNHPEPGKNYGWATITYGEEYSGKPIGDGITQKDGFEQPVYYWDPVIAPSGMTFYEGDLFPALKHSLLIGSLKEQHVDRLVLKDGKVVGEERLFTDIGGRVRDVVAGPDGAIYVVTDEDDGKLIRITPKG